MKKKIIINFKEKEKFMDIYNSIKDVKNIGEKRAEILNKMGIYTVYDLLNYYPRTYDDRSFVVPISDIDENERVSIKARIYGKFSTFTNNGLNITSVNVVDDSGICKLIFYNKPYMKNTLKSDEEYIFYGKAKGSSKNKSIEVFDYDKNLLDSDKNHIVPIYTLPKGLSQKVFRSIIKSVLDTYSFTLEEYFPEFILKRYDLCKIDFATKAIHFPLDDDDFFTARNRLVFDELFFIKGAMNNIKRFAKKVTTVKMERLDISDFDKTLPYKLTNDQQKTVHEVIDDFFTGFNMNRLVCGDVGSGKTVVSAKICYFVIKNGYQCAIMAPTEVLARQHYNEFQKFFAPFGIEVAFLSGSLKAKEKREMLEHIKTGSAKMVVGTHALIQKGVVFNNLGLSITDEQHRFGVRQRGILNEKGDVPHMLVLTATPIPRTLGLILYGDLDISTIRSMPKGRVPIDTFVVNSTYTERLYAFIEKEVREKHSVYVVCPLIEESEKSTINSVMAKHMELTNTLSKDIVSEVMHGKMKDDEKQLIMQKFKNGEIDVLVSTTVIEVGVDCKNATLMIIFDADRFGLSALHQLRGRVGRSDLKSYCILVSDKKKKETRERLKIMESTKDGFMLSQKDLEIRGHGQFFGNRQHGVPDSKIANLYEDLPILEKTTDLWNDIFNGAVNINDYEKLKNKIDEFEKTRLSTVYL